MCVYIYIYILSSVYRIPLYLCIFFINHKFFVRIFAEFIFDLKSKASSSSFSSIEIIQNCMIFVQSKS